MITDWLKTIIMLFIRANTVMLLCKTVLIVNLFVCKDDKTTRSRITVHSGGSWCQGITVAQGITVKFFQDYSGKGLQQSQGITVHELDSILNSINA